MLAINRRYPRKQLEGKQTAECILRQVLEPGDCWKIREGLPTQEHQGGWERIEQL